MDFSFLKASSAVSQPALKRVNSDKSTVKLGDSSDLENTSPIEFTIQPNVVKIPAGTQAVMLNVTGKLKNSYTLESEDLVLERRNSQKLPDPVRQSSLKNKKGFKKSVSVDV